MRSKIEKERMSERKKKKNKKTERKIEENEREREREMLQNHPSPVKCTSMSSLEARTK